LPAAVRPGDLVEAGVEGYPALSISYPVVADE